MDLAFFNEIGGRSAGGMVLGPARRLLRRVLRPTFFRLRDVLAAVRADQEADRGRVERLERRVEELEARLAAARPVLADYLQLGRRLEAVEDRPAA